MKVLASSLLCLIAVIKFLQLLLDQLADFRGQTQQGI